MDDIRPIEITTENGEHFTLEFSRDSVRFAEQHGFSIEYLEKAPMSGMYDLFFYAFRMHHKNVPRDKTDAILNGFDGLSNLPDGFIERLGKLYAKPFETLADEDVKKVKATIQM